MKNFVTLQEIIEIYCVSRKLVRDIIRHYNIDCYKQEDMIYIDLKNFHKIYTSKYNPVLFEVEEKKEQKMEFLKPIMESKINKTFFSIFTEPIDCKQKLRKMVMTYAE